MTLNAQSSHRKDLHSVTFVLSSPRTGSTLLARDIASLGGLGLPSETFRDLGSEAKKRTLSEEDLLERLGAGVQDDSPGVGAVKLMVGQARPAAEALTGIRAETPGDAICAIVEWAMSRFENVCTVILVRNALDQAISRVVAQQTGVFHSTDPVLRKAGGELPLDMEGVSQRIIEEWPGVLRNRRALQQVAATFADSALLLTYDELTMHEPETTARLIGHAQQRGFAPKREAPVRKLEKIVSPVRASLIRDTFFEYLKHEPGL